MLRPSRPMIRPFISSDGRWTTETVCSAVWSAATRWMAVTTTSRALSSASSRAPRSMARASLTASCSASSRTSSSRIALASSAVMLGDPLERRDLLLRARGPAPRGSCRARARGRAACGRAARACRCAGRAARRAASRRRSRSASSARLARASSSASRCRRSCSSLAWRMRSFCWARASATMRRASDWSPPSSSAMPTGSRTKTPTYGSADGGHHGHRQDDHGIHILILPSGRLRAGRA